MTTPLFVSVVIPCRNEAGFIAACLKSVLGNDYPASALEVLVVDGMSDDGTREVLADFERHHSRVRMLDNPCRITPTALNIGVHAARGDVIIRMDAHNHYPTHYVSGLVRWLETSGADNVGGVWRTKPANGSVVARTIAVALAHPFAVGNAHYRTGASEPRWVDTVPFGCYRRDVFDRIGLFDEELIRNQDDEFNHRLLKAGGRILLVPDVSSDYFARASFSKLSRMLYQYGYFKPLAARKLGRLLTFRQIVPAVFVLGLALSLSVLLFGDSVARLAVLTPIAVYVFVAVVAGVRVVPRNGVAVAAMLLPAFVVIHVSYGLGFLRGVMDFVVASRGAPSQESIALTR